MDTPVATSSATPASCSVWFLRRAFAGQVPLWKAFWLFFVPTPLLLSGLYIGALWVHLHFFDLVHLELFVFASSLFIFLCISVPASVVWRCAANARRRYWGYIAQFVVAVFLLWYGLKTLSLFWVV